LFSFAILSSRNFSACGDAEDVTPKEPEYVDQSAQDLKMKQIKDKVESNPLDTASHSELITELRNQGMVQIFPVKLF